VREKNKNKAGSDAGADGSAAAIDQDEKMGKR